MQSFQELLSQTSWIGRETKDLAAQKVDAMMLRIGYPDFILNPQLLNVQYEDVSNCMYRSERNTLRLNSQMCAMCVCIYAGMQDLFSTIFLDD